MKGTSLFKGMPHNILATGLTSFFTDISTKMVYSVMPLFLMSIGASKTTISLIEGIAESTASLLKALSGYWSDKIGRNKPFMLIGYGVTMLVTPLYALVARPVGVLVIRFVERVGKGLRTAPRDSLISNSVEKSDAGRCFGFQKAMDNSGAIVGPLLAVLLLALLPGGYRSIFLIAALPALLGVLSVAIGVREVKSAVRHTHGRRMGIAVLCALPGRIWLFLLAVAVFSLGNSSDALLLVKTAETGVSETAVPFVYMIFNATSVLLAMPIGRLSDRVGREKLIVAGFLTYVTYFLFGCFNSLPLFMLLFVMYGLYSALTDVSQKAFISDLVDKDLKGVGYGLYHAVLGLTLLPASLIGGWMYDHVDAAVPFYFGAGMALLASLLMLLFFIVCSHLSSSPAN